MYELYLGKENIFKVIEAAVPIFLGGGFLLNTAIFLRRKRRRADTI